jgi:hypothetical protein
MLNLARVRHRGNGGRDGCGRHRLCLPAVGRTLVLAMMDVPTVPVTPAMMARVSGMATPVMDDRAGVIGPLRGGRRTRPDGCRRGENARDE